MVFGIIARVISFLSSFPAYVVASIFFFSNTKLFALLILALLLSSAFIWIFRIFIRIERPDIHSFEENLAHRHIRGKIAEKLKEQYFKLERRSFASAHVARVAAFGYLYYVFNPSVEIIILFCCIALIVAFARLYLKRHRRFDVLVGFIVGLGAGYLAEYLMNFLWPMILR
jgi:membrane-associated phospholipid phosphatase